MHALCRRLTIVSLRRSAIPVFRCSLIPIIPLRFGTLPVRRMSTAAAMEMKQSSANEILSTGARSASFIDEEDFAGDAVPRPVLLRKRSSRSSRGPMEEKKTESTMEATVESIPQAKTPRLSRKSSSRSKSTAAAEESKAPGPGSSPLSSPMGGADTPNIDESLAELAGNTQEMPAFEVSLPVLESQTSITEMTVNEDGTVMAATSTEVEVVAQVKKTRKRKVKVIPTYDESNFHPQAFVSKKWIGAHVSTAGGPVNAIYNANAIGARAFAMDTRSKRRWVTPPLAPEEAEKFRNAMHEFHYEPTQILPHGSYLMNLGSPHEEMRKKSIQCLLEELERCAQLGLHLYNFHPGSGCGIITREQAMTRIADALNEAHEKTKHFNGGKGVVTVLENMAGQGGVIGNQLSDLKTIIDQVHDKSRVGVCIDTCHTFASGIDLRTTEAVDAFFAEFKRIFGGFQYLRGFHFNDSKGELGCKRDRHESIGLGKLGVEAFCALLARRELDQLPLILETPCPDLKQQRAKYANEVAGLYELEANALPETREGRPLEYHELTAEEIAERKQKRKELLEKRRAKKAAAAAGVDEEDENEDEEEDEGPELEEDAEDEEEKPKSSRKRSISRQASTDKKRGKSNGNAAEEDEDMEEKPKPKRQRSKNSKTKAEGSTEEDGEDVQEMPKPKRQRSKASVSQEENEVEEIAPPKRSASKPAMQRQKSAGSRKSQSED